MTHARTAIDTIRGYYYQFDLYALQLLESDNEEITLEGIEDIDICNATETTAIQCKYYEGTTYNHSVIAEPVRLMLNHFAKHMASSFCYKLYGFYKNGQEKLSIPLTVEFVKKKFLTFSTKGVKHEYHNELGLKDEDISLFISRLTIDIDAKSFDEQNAKLIEAIKSNLDCTQIEAENLYYPLILKLVREIATDKNVVNRRIDKNTFIARINAHKNPLVDIWFAGKCKSDDYLKRMHKTYFSVGLNMNPYERFFLIDCDKNITDAEIKHLVSRICTKWSKCSLREPHPYVPYIYLHGLSNVRLVRLKELLYGDGILINDGHPFHLSKFQAKEIVLQPTPGKRIIKIIDEVATIDEVLQSIHDKTREIYQFYLEKPFYTTTEEHRIVSIFIETTKEVEQII